MADIIATDLQNGERSPKRRRIDNGGDDSADELGFSSRPDTPFADDQPAWSSSNNQRRRSSTRIDPAPDREDSPDELDHTFLRNPRPLPRKRLRSLEPSVTPGLESARTPEGESFLERPRRARSNSTRRSPTPVTPVTQDGYQVSSPVQSHSTGPTYSAHEDVNYKPKLIMRGHKRAIAAVKFSPNGKWIASCSADATARIWSASTGAPIHTLNGHLAGISCLAWAPDSLTLATGSDDKTIRLWNALTGDAHPNPLLGHHNYVYSLSFSPAGNMLVSGSYDEAVFLWDVRSAQLMRSLPAHSDPVGGVDFVRDGTLVVSCSSDGLIRVWDTATGQCLRTFFHEDTPPVVSVKFSPNGKYILTWMLDDSIRMWNYVEGRCVKTYQGHINCKYSLQGAFGTYDRNEEDMAAMIASGSEDGAIMLWDVNTKRVLQRLGGHNGAVMSVDVHPTEKAIVSCGLDKTIRIWRDTGHASGVNGRA